MNTITLMKRNVSKFHPSWRWHSTGENSSEALQIIFGYLPYLDLCNCAIVSKKWRKVAIEEIQSRCAVNVKNNDEVSFVLQKLKASSNFRVGKCIIGEAFVDSVLMMQMLMKLQSTLNALKLDISSNTQGTFLFKLLANLPNLTHFTVTSIFNSSSSPQSKHAHNDNNYSNQNRCSVHNWIIPFSNRQEEQCNTVQCGASDLGLSSDEKSRFVHVGVRYLHFDAGQYGEFQLSKIFQAFPNLVELTISNIVNEPRKNLKYSLCKNLKHFTLRQYSNVGFPGKLVQTLIKLEMNLEKLMLIFPPSVQSSLNKNDQDASILLKQFIELQAASMKTLKLIQVEDEIINWNKSTSSSSSAQRNVAWNVPIIDMHAISSYHWNFNYSLSSISLFPINLPNLEAIHVQKPLITNLAQVVKHFPKLKQLSVQVSPFGSNWKGMLPLKLEPHMRITTLKLDFIDPDSLSRLGFCFPALKFLQMSYCDESLFNVLCKRIPSFNGGAAKESLLPCLQCHGSNERKFSLYTNEPGKSDGISVNKGVHHGRDKTQSFKQGQVEDQCCMSKSIISFKNLKLLRVRPCHHSPYENFVFLQNEIGTSVQSSTVTSGITEHNFLLGDDISSDTDELDSSVGFTWNATDVMKDKKFVDLPLNCSENAESCSSA